MTSTRSWSCTRSTACTARCFREPHRGRDELGDYLRWSFADERVDDVRFSEPVIGRNGLAVAEFRVLSEVNEEPQTLAGCVFVRFDASGLAVETRDYWHTVPDHTEPARPMFLL
ncbi:nuclear transport factor 2 family protein [Streptomyces sp. NPDC057474]|uniref:nuclear transport factor 2 family protein n=1 Tax=Streptomyces sp. NPDC057474 TaxID=3346144 RepID=UPI0036C72D0F